ncbi:MAG: phosphatase PAP2 family protein [Candidatus Cloacimonetes bacterium]|nr:phosphatase PAP2 family protein [Candidatus Cloacimonadota bacterium]
MALSFSGAALFANSSWDQNVQNWYQRKCRTSFTDKVSNGFKFFGEGYYLVPFSLLTASMSYIPTKSATISTIAEWGENSSRAYLVGAPFLLLAQRATGASRPSEGDGNSQWDFFADENGFSGHAFIGAVPFLSLAELHGSDKRIYWSSLILSTLPALSRINDNKHYFSQAFLGWFIALRAVGAVSVYEEQNFAIYPILRGKDFGFIGRYEW